MRPRRRLARRRRRQRGQAGGQRCGVQAVRGIDDILLADRVGGQQRQRHIAVVAAQDVADAERWYVAEGEAYARYGALKITSMGTGLEVTAEGSILGARQPSMQAERERRASRWEPSCCSTAALQLSWSLLSCCSPALSLLVSPHSLLLTSGCSGVRKEQEKQESGERRGQREWEHGSQGTQPPTTAPRRSETAH